MRLRKFLFRVQAVIAAICITFAGSPASGQDVGFTGTVLHLSATTLPTYCSNGDVRVNSSILQICNSNTWAGIGSLPSVVASTSNTSYFPVFVAANSTSQQAITVGPMTYNPSTNVLTATTFAGNASTATSATSATNATTTALTTKSDNVSYFLEFVSANSSSNQAHNVGPATYNPSTSTLTATTFVGALTGNATNVTASSNTSLTSLSNLATIGTITSGTWNGTKLAAAYQQPATQSLTTCSTARTIDWSTGNTFDLLLTNGNTCVLTFSNPTDAQVINIWLHQPASTGSAVVTFPTVKWFPSGQPTITTGASALDVCTCTYNATAAAYACSCLQNGG